MRPNIIADIIIVGAGLIGMSLAARLGRAGLGVIVIERNPMLEGDYAAQAPLDLRTTAVAAGCQNFLQQIGAWQDAAQDAGIIQQIRVSDGESRRFLHFGGNEINDHEIMGYIVHNAVLRRDLLAAIENIPQITLIQPAEIERLVETPQNVTVHLNDGRQCQAALVIGTEGRTSKIRQLIGVNCCQKSYGQTALVTVIRHELPHQNIAHERFLAAGPLAFLPMRDPYESSIVWTESNDMALHLAGLSPSEREQELQIRFGDTLGRLTQIEPAQTFPLGLNFAYEISRGRLALAGDAAHLIHPIAGQGANLGWRDAQDLAELVIAARHIGLDAGYPVLMGHYQRSRMLENLLFAAATDGFNRLFSNENKILQATRRLGLSLVNQMPRLQSAFIRPARVGL